jgi:hypothetical protein
MGMNGVKRSYEERVGRYEKRAREGEGRGDLKSGKHLPPMISRSDYKAKSAGYLLRG